MGFIGATIRGLYRDYHRDPFPHSLPSTRQDWHVRRSAAEAVPANLRADGTSILREVVRRNVVKTVCRVGLWSLFTGLGAYWLFPAGQKLWLVLLTGSAESGA